MAGIPVAEEAVAGSADGAVAEADGTLTAVVAVVADGAVTEADGTMTAVVAVGGVVETDEVYKLKQT